MDDEAASAEDMRSWLISGVPPDEVKRRLWPDPPPPGDDLHQRQRSWLDQLDQLTPPEQALRDRMRADAVSRTTLTVDPPAVHVGDPDDPEVKQLLAAAGHSGVLVIPPELSISWPDPPPPVAVVPGAVREAVAAGRCPACHHALHVGGGCAAGDRVHDGCACPVDSHTAPALGMETADLDALARFLGVRRDDIDPDLEGPEDDWRTRSWDAFDDVGPLDIEYCGLPVVARAALIAGAVVVGWAIGWRLARPRG